MRLSETSTLLEPAMISGRTWTAEAVRNLGLTTDIATAGAILGIGRSRAYVLAKAGNFPVRIIRVGRSYVVPTAALLDLLGL